MKEIMKKYSAPMSRKTFILVCFIYGIVMSSIMMSNSNKKTLDNSEDLDNKTAITNEEHTDLLEAEEENIKDTTAVGTMKIQRLVINENHPSNKTYTLWQHYYQISEDYFFCDREGYYSLKTEPTGNKKVMVTNTGEEDVEHEMLRIRTYYDEGEIIEVEVNALGEIIDEEELEKPYVKIISKDFN